MGLGSRTAQEDPEDLVRPEIQVILEAQGDPASHSLPWSLEAPSASGKV